MSEAALCLTSISYSVLKLRLQQISVHTEDFQALFGSVCMSVMSVCLSLPGIPKDGLWKALVLLDKDPLNKLGPRIIQRFRISTSKGYLIIRSNPN